MSQSLPIDSQARWKQRFRAPTLSWSQVAAHAPDRGLVASNLSGTYQLHAWDVSTGGLKQVSYAPKGVFIGRLSGDGRFIYYLHDEDGDEMGRFVRVPFTGGKPQELTPELPPYFADPYLSPTGTMLGFLVGEPEGVDLYVVPLGPNDNVGAPRRVFHNPVPGLLGRRLLALSSAGTTAIMISKPHNPSTYEGLLAIDLATGECIDQLQAEPDTSVALGDYSPVLGDERLWATIQRGDTRQHLIWNPRTGERLLLDLSGLVGASPCSWSPDGTRLLLWQEDQGHKRFAISTPAEQSIQVLSELHGTYWSSYFGNTGEIYTHWGMIQDGSVVGPEIVALDAISGTQRRPLVAFDPVPSGRPWQSVSFSSSDGQEVQAWLMTPEGEGPYPAIIDLHGGPHLQRMVDPAPDLQMWVDHGFAVLSVNYRGSTGFGKAFEQRIVGNAGHWEVEDIIAARTWLVAEGLARPETVMLTGWSYGGYLTLLALGKYPDLWAAGMAGTAIANWGLLYEDTHEALKVSLPIRLLGGTPEEKPAQYRVSSPITYAEQVKAPVLIIQGRHDRGCPPRQMEQYVARLQALGKQIEIDWFDSGHGSLHVEEQIGLYERMLTFALSALKAK